jgi:5-methylthioadenosine/S-adenosylhomocysteine deaminase
MPAATLIRGGIILPMTARGTLWDPGAVLVEGDRIVAAGPDAEVAADPRAADAEVVDAAGCAVIPGLHNGHLHSGLLRGTAESLSLWDWLTTYVDPAHRALTPEIAAAASRLCYAESVLAGTTSVMDMWRFMEGSAAAAEQIGLRATLVPYVADAEGYDYFETLETNRALLETTRSAAAGRVRTWVGLEHLLYCTLDCFAGAAALAAEYDTGIHTHSSESIWEVQESLKRWGRRPIEVMYQRGILGPRTVIAHCVWLDDREIRILADTGTSVVHCPCSNMKLSSGAARVGAMRAAGIAVGLGSDGEKENNNLDLLEEMKFASLLQKVSTLDPTTGDPWEMLAMATIDGARALGLAEITGSLEVGKRADITVVDLTGLHTTPLLHGRDSNVAAHLVFSAGGHDVRDVWVDGRRLVADGVPTTFDIATVRSDGQAAAEELFARRAALAETAHP